MSKKNVTIRLPEPLIERLKGAAKRDLRNVSSQIELYVREGLARSQADQPATAGSR